MPRSVFGANYPFLPRAELLTFEETQQVTRAFFAHGVRKVRLTGGEPLLRRDLPKLVELLCELELDDVALTTNGMLLGQHAQALADAGLKRVTVSLDALDDTLLEKITDTRVTSKEILAGIEAADAAGLAPIKVNAVIRRGVNESQVLELARAFRGTSSIVRFIEFMDVGASNGWNPAEVVSAEEMIATISARYPLTRIEGGRGDVAERWRYDDGAGEIGVIASVTRPFCGGCQRARLSADGKLFTCLFATTGHDLKSIVRSGSRDDLDRAIGSIWGRRTDRYSELRQHVEPNDNDEPPRVEMSYIGG